MCGRESVLSRRIALHTKHHKKSLRLIGVNYLREHVIPDARLHYVITNGGEAPNIIPAHSAGLFIVRSMDNVYLEELKDKVLNCFKGAAIATGATLKYRWEEKKYASMKNNMTMAGLFEQNMKSLGRIMEGGLA